jgi:hypothetical protein
LRFSKEKDEPSFHFFSKDSPMPGIRQNMIFARQPLAAPGKLMVVSLPGEALA